MRANMGTTDRAIRAVIAVVLLALVGLKVVTGTLAIVLGVVAAVFLGTAFLAFCPAYVPFGFNTCGVRRV